ncbi:hypothetical protein BS50DRAFT_227969 [Corynespora cassiicola Philippines]|uniref:Uncharacterized protein n=1 Tax=Corynespora cassiicola Philippines TaxID=1448308 RepID=A0A2T2N2P8_CORCC|nr:hypothetical protein BS50DRAFT_227969 [Corynespora cassiicola Philippines]
MDRDASLLGPSYSSLRKGRWAPVRWRWVEEEAVKETLQQGRHLESSASDFSYDESSVARTNLHHSLTAPTSSEHLAALPPMMSSDVQTIYAPVSAQATSTPAFPFESPSFDGFSSLPFGPHNDWPFRGFSHAIDESNAAFENHQNLPIPIQTPASEQLLGYVTDLALYRPLSDNIDNPTIAVASEILPSDTLSTPQRLQSSIQPELLNDWPGTAWNTPDPGHGEIRTPVMALAASNSGYALANVCTPPEVTVAIRSSDSPSSATGPLSTPSSSKSSRSSHHSARSTRNRAWGDPGHEVGLAEPEDSQ